MAGYRTILATLTALVFFGAAPALSDWDNVRIVEESRSGVTFVATYGELELETRYINGQPLEVPLMEGSRPRLVCGQPVLPVQTILVAAPPGARVSVQMIDGMRYLASVPNIPSAPAIALEDPDLFADAFGGSASCRRAGNRPDRYPDEVVFIEQDGYMRDRRMLMLRINPLIVDPVDSTALVHVEVEVRISFDRSSEEVQAGGSEGGRNDPLFERLCDRLVLNHRTAKSLGAAADPSVRVQKRDGKDFRDSDPAVKIYVETAGLYRLAPSDLASLGIETSGLDPRSFRVHVGGQEAAIYVRGEDDGSFDDGDFLVFYGEPVYGSHYADTNCYWLTYGGEDGLRALDRDASVTGAAPLADAFLWTATIEENHSLWSSTPDWENHDIWFYDWFTAPNSMTIDGQIPDPGTGTPDAVVRSYFHGRSETASDPDHHTRVLLNGELIQEEFWDGMVEHVIESDVDQDLLDPGENTFDIEFPNGSGAYTDQQYFNKIEVDYYRLFKALDDALRFRGPGEGLYEFRVDGFDDPDILVFEVTDPLGMERLTGASVQETDAFEVSFETFASTSGWFEIASVNGFQDPVDVKVDEPSSLASASNGADYIILTHQELYDAALPLEARRASQGLRSMTIRIEDVYDEFAYGVADPMAIRHFLQYAYLNWQSPAPLYVLLLGDATVDYHGYLASSASRNLVPSYLVTTATLGATPSDNPFFLAGEDPYPDFYSGRIPAENAAYVSQIIEKIEAYEQAPLDAWHLAASYAADNGEPLFETASENLIFLTPDEFSKERIYISQLGGSGARTAVREAINQGRLLFSYVGHGNVTNWAGEYILSSWDIPNLTNGFMSPFVCAFDCLNGYFPRTESVYCLNEALIAYAGKGSCATFGPTAYGYTGDHICLSEKLWRNIFEDDVLELGAATTNAKISAYGTDGISYEIVDQFVFFGDPAMAIRRDLSLIDTDQDGWARDVDCDDRNPDVNPGATEVCNGIDDNCADGIDEGGDGLCDDGQFCNGQETCGGASGCLYGEDPCDPVHETCNEQEDSCDIDQGMMRVIGYLHGFWTGSQHRCQTSVTVELYGDPDSSADYSFVDVSLSAEGKAFVDLASAGVASGDYYVVVRHYNHLDLVSAGAFVWDTVTPISADFSIAGNVDHGDRDALILYNGKLTMPGGDANADGRVNLGDFGNLLGGWNGTAVECDFDCDGYCRLSDYPILLNAWNRQSYAPD